MAASLEPDFSHLIAQAETLARRRHEEMRGVHLLAAAAAVPGSVSRALQQQGASFRRVMDQWDRFGDMGPGENLYLLRRRVREVARAFGTRTPDATHLTLALLDDTHGSARRVLEGLSVDVQVLSAQIGQIGQGLPSSVARTAVAQASPARGQVVPVMPRDPVRSAKTNESRPAPLSSQNAAASRAAATSKNVSSAAMGRGRTTGQALSTIPQVGPTPLPGLRAPRGNEPQGESAEDKSAESLIQEIEQAIPTAAPTAEAAPVATELPADNEGETGELGDLTAAEVEIMRARYGLSKKKFPILTQVGRNLTLQAALGATDPVVGRDEEIEEALDILAKRQGNNPCLIGEAGVGKTSVARGVATTIFSNEDDDRIVIEIPISELVAGTGVRGALAGRLAALKKEVKAANDRVILFFDEIHQLFSGDAAEEMAGDLKLSLSRGELPCIGATTTSEYRRVIEADAVLCRRFSPVEIEEPAREDAFLILSSLAPRLRAHHGVEYQEEAIALSIAWSLRYLPGRCLPDKAVALLDLAGARTRRRKNESVTPPAVAEVVAAQANMPVERLLESDAERMLQLREILCERVIGHEEHLERIARILRRNAAGLGGRRPIGTFLLLGPTGVGKTETAKAIAEVLFHSESAMTRIDMAEMSESHAVAKLVGAPPGYVGHDAGGQLTEAVRRRPYQVVLLDEIEKAHPEVLTAFLAVFDEGRMTDSRGRLVDFTNTVLILTSNLGGAEMASGSRKRVGFSSGQAPVTDTQKLVVGAARKALPPELFNRIDEVLPFAPLTRSDVRKIGRKLCQGLADEIELSRGVALSICDSAIEVLLDAGGFDPELGARPLRRMVARRIEAPLAEAILSGELTAGDTWMVEGNNGELVFDVVPATEAGAAE
jgi:ATP-dependent Clp protease ATP-binding subunit ClpC